MPAFAASDSSTAIKHRGITVRWEISFTGGGRIARKYSERRLVCKRDTRICDLNGAMAENASDNSRVAAKVEHRHDGGHAGLDDEGDAKVSAAKEGPAKEAVFLG